MAEPTPADLNHPQPVPVIGLPNRDRLGAPLPAPLSTFVGREQEVAAVTELLRRPEVRFVTLLGPGGVGKTRLALRVAHEVAPKFADGAVFVDLAPISEPELVLSRIAETLGLRDSGDPPLAEQVVRFLRGRHLVLILDNFEHVVGAAPRLAEVLRACPSLVALATSRVLLRISGEHAFDLPPLSLPPPDVIQPSALLESDAVQLFTARARAAWRQFALTPHNTAAVVEVCRRVDGLPLALELAAAQVRHQEPGELLAGLVDHLPVLADGPRDQPARQQSMAAAVAWSYDLLGDDDRDVFRRLAACVGGFDLDAARAVCGREVRRQVATLQDHSLLQRHGANGASRFMMLEMIREFGLAKLVESGQEQEVRQAHAAHFLDFAELAREHAWESDQVHWLDRMESDHGNLRSALVWLEQSQTSEALLRLVAALGVFWGRRGHLGETFRWTERALAVSEGSTSWARARVVHNKGTDLSMQGDLAGAAVWLAEAASLFEGLGDRQWRAYSLNNLGKVKLAQGKIEEATSLYEQALATGQDTGDQGVIATAHANLGQAAARRGDLAEAEAHFTESLRMHQEIGYSWDEAEVLMNLGGLAAARGEQVRASQLCQTATARALELGDPMLVVGCLERLAIVFIKHPARAARLLGAAQALGERAGGRLDPAAEPVAEAAIASLRAALGGDAFSAEWTAGRALSVAAAVAEAATFEPTDQPTPMPTSGALRGAGLTPRELDVLQLLVEGYSNREIAGTLFISPRTVGNHVTSILAKLGAPSRTAAVVMARRLGLA